MSIAKVKNSYFLQIKKFWYWFGNIVYLFFFIFFFISFYQHSVDRGGSDELSFNSVLHKNYNS